jgi:hypothetical protein
MAVVLIAVLLVSLCGVGLLQLASSSAVDISKYHRRTQAFWALEGGLQYATAIAMSNRNEGVEDAFLTPLPSWTQTIARTTVVVGPVSYTNESFELLAHLDSPAGLTKDLQVTLTQTNPLPYGLFGTDRLEMSASQIAGYDSGSLTQVTSGYQSVYSGPPDSSYHTSKLIEMGNTDPLGVFPVGPLAKVFDGPALWTNVFVDSTQTNWPTYEAGNYYFNNFTWNSTSAVMNVDVLSGPVNLFLKGGLTNSLGTQVVVTNGPPSRFRIFANGNSPKRIEFRVAGDFGAFVYAPDMDIDIDCQGDFQGGAWGRDVRINTHGHWIKVDVNLYDYATFVVPNLPTNVYRIVSSDWKRIPR